MKFIDNLFTRLYTIVKYKEEQVTRKGVVVLL